MKPEQRFEEETALKEARRREQKEAHLYMFVKVITDATFRNYGGTDLAGFDGDHTSDPSAPFTYRLRRAMTVGEFIDFFAAETGQDAKRLRPWLMVNRQNKTVRPDQPIMDLDPTLEEVSTKAATRDSYLRFWVEQAEDVDEEGNAVWPSYARQPNGAPTKSDTILLLLKHFDADEQTLRGAGHVYISKDKKVEELVPLILQKMGWEGKLAPEEKLLLWEVCHLPPTRASAA
jgi:ubiquitin carboxyl-terminal hydrolase 7